MCVNDIHNPSVALFELLPVKICFPMRRSTILHVLSCGTLFLSLSQRAVEEVVCVCLVYTCIAMHFRFLFLFTLKVGIDAVPLFVVPFLLLLFSHCPHTRIPGDEESCRNEEVEVERLRGEKEATEEPERIAKEEHEKVC